MVRFCLVCPLQILVFFSRSLCRWFSIGNEMVDKNRKQAPYAHSMCQTMLFYATHSVLCLSITVKFMWLPILFVINNLSILWAGSIARNVVWQKCVQEMFSVNRKEKIEIQAELLCLYKVRCILGMDESFKQNEK